MLLSSQCVPLSRLSATLSEQLHSQVQGISKRLFPGCENLWSKHCVFLPAEGKQNATLSPDFTQPGKGLLEIPCMKKHMSRPFKKGFLPFDMCPIHSVSLMQLLWQDQKHVPLLFLVSANAVPRGGECRNFPLLTACEKRVPGTSAKSHDSSRNGLYQRCIPLDLAKFLCWGVV